MSDAAHKVLYQRFLPDDHQQAFVWKFSHLFGGRRPRHFHNEPELNLVVTGSATFGVGNRTVRVSQGELLVFPSGQDHVLLESSPDLYLYAIGLDPAYSAEVLGAACGPVVPIHVRLGSGELAGVLDRASAIVDRPFAEQLGAELWERVHWLGRQRGELASHATHVLTRRAMQVMETAPELGLEALSGELRVHPSEISRHFHRDVGVTLVRYRTRVRLLRFMRLVDAGETDLMTVASAVGFGSYSQCHRAFHAELGCAPRQFFAKVRDRMQLAYDDYMESSE